MKDLNLSRLIHVATVTTLVVSTGACGGKKKKDEEDPVPDKDVALLTVCEATLECDPDSFYDEYEDLDDCLESSRENHDELVADESQDCNDSLLKLLDCFGNAFPETCDEYYAAYDCIPEGFGVVSDCESVSGI